MKRAISICCAALMALVCAASFVPFDVRAGEAHVIRVMKRPSCGCCTRWVEHLKNNGFKTHVSESGELTALRARLGVPKALAACHTAQIDGYVIEGHVPAHAIKRILAERPNATGLAVPGMPVGSPGMEGGTPEIYDVILFSKNSQQSFGTYQADAVVPK